MFIDVNGLAPARPFAFGIPDFSRQISRIWPPGLPRDRGESATVEGCPSSPLSGGSAEPGSFPGCSKLHPITMSRYVCESPHFRTSRLMNSTASSATSAGRWCRRREGRRLPMTRLARCRNLRHRSGDDTSRSPSEPGTAQCPSSGLIRIPTISQTTQSTPVKMRTGQGYQKATTAHSA